MTVKELTGLWLVSGFIVTLIKIFLIVVQLGQPLLALPELMQDVVVYAFPFPFDLLVQIAIGATDPLWLLLGLTLQVLIFFLLVWRTKGR